MRPDGSAITPLDLKCTSTSTIHRDVQRVKPEINVKPAKRLPSSTSHEPRDATTASVANGGVVRPPLVVLASLLSGTVLTVAWPLPFFPGVLGLPLGGLLVAM